LKNLISYSLFGKEDRYWASIPFILIANELIYDGFINRFYVHKEVTENPLFKLFVEVANRTSKLEYEIIEEPYKATEPTTWRMRPLWDKDVEFLFCRDIDATPRSDERQATLLFQKSRFAIHGIRSYWTHQTKLMAGLCGFNVPRVRKVMVHYKSFEDYKNFGRKFVKHHCTEWQWGCDQHLLQIFFFAGRNGYYLTKQTLDTCLGSANVLPWFKCIRLPKEQYGAVSLEHINPEIIRICDSLVPYVGLPLTVESTYLRQALKIDCEMSRILNQVFSENPDLASYYKVEEVESV
jgi:hypothetical protein